MGSHGPGDMSRKTLRIFRQDNVHTDIFTPRTYQVELLDVALQKNTMVCLSTDVAKTFVGVLLIKELAHQVRPPVNEGKKNTVFLVPSAGLVQQQASVVCMHTDLSVGAYAEVSELTTWSCNRWIEEFRQNNVLVMTAEIFLDILLRGLLSLSCVNLLIFDECHHAQGNHPYVQVMKCYDVCPVEERPRILGLTASVLNSKCDTPQELEHTVSSLEEVLSCTAETATDMVVADQYGSKPTEIILESDDYEDRTSLVEEFGAILDSSLFFLEDCAVGPTPGENEKDPREIPKAIFKECQNILNRLGPFCLGKIAEVFVKQLVKVRDQEVEETPLQFLEFTLTQLRIIQKVMLEVTNTKVMSLEDLLEYVNPKVIRLVDILHDFKPDDNFLIIGGEDYMDAIDDDSEDDSLDLSDDDMEDDDDCSDRGKSNQPQIHYVARSTKTSPDEDKDEGLCGIIFCDRRHTALALNKLLDELVIWDPDIFFVHSHHLTGHSSPSPVGGGMYELQFKKQEKILRNFRQRELNLLVSTSVLEEGVDVPRCNLVVRFDVPLTYRSYVQSKGRARANNAKYYIIINKAKREEFDEDLKLFKGIEKILTSKCHNREQPTQEDVDNALADTLLPPYMPVQEDGSPRVTMTTAISLVNRYCSKLPSDAFTHLTPRCDIEKLTDAENGDDIYVATLQLPINSPIKAPITGNPMPKKILAKMAVALKTCEILHKAGELDDHLLPVGKEIIKYEDEENEWEDTEAMGQARPGTTKRKQYYHKKIADALIGRPRPDSPFCLYVFNLILSCPITEEQNTRGRKIYAPEETPRGLGLISDKKLPLVPKFPVFTRSGEVTVSVDLLSCDVCFSAEEFGRLERFHRFIINNVLRLEKDPMTFDPENAECAYLVVPLTKDGVDWEFVKQIENSSLKTTKKGAQEENNPKEIFHFDKKQFDDAVVMPSYRNIDQPQCFYVAEIKYDLSPRSSFPSPELYDTFQHYYSKKYGLQITSPDQPLLDVDHTSARLNLLTPRYMNQKGVALPTSSAETRRARRENLQQKQILIPELCDIHPFPASLWRKAVCLPAILYRVNYLLIAEEIRIRIAGEAHIGVVHLRDDYRFPELEFGFSTKSSDYKLGLFAEGDSRSQDAANSTETESSEDEETVKSTQLIEERTVEQTSHAGTTVTKPKENELTDVMISDKRKQNTSEENGNDDDKCNYEPEKNIHDSSLSHLRNYAEAADSNQTICQDDPERLIANVIFCNKSESNEKHSGEMPTKDNEGSPKSIKLAGLENAVTSGCHHNSELSHKAECYPVTPYQNQKPETANLVTHNDNTANPRCYIPTAASYTERQSSLPIKTEAHKHNLSETNAELEKSESNNTYVSNLDRKICQHSPEHIAAENRAQHNTPETSIQCGISVTNQQNSTSETNAEYSTSETIFDEATSPINTQQNHSESNNECRQLKTNSEQKPSATRASDPNNTSDPKHNPFKINLEHEDLQSKSKNITSENEPTSSYSSTDNNSKSMNSPENKLDDGSVSCGGLQQSAPTCAEEHDKQQSLFQHQFKTSNKNNFKNLSFDRDRLSKIINSPTDTCDQIAGLNIPSDASVVNNLAVFDDHQSNFLKNVPTRCPERDQNMSVTEKPHFAFEQQQTGRADSDVNGTNITENEHIFQDLSETKHLIVSTGCDKVQQYSLLDVSKDSNDLSAHIHKMDLNIDEAPRGTDIPVLSHGKSPSLSPQVTTSVTNSEDITQSKQQCPYSADQSGSSCSKSPIEMPSPHIHISIIGDGSSVSQISTSIPSFTICPGVEDAPVAAVCDNDGTRQTRSASLANRILCDGANDLPNTGATYQKVVEAQSNHAQHSSVSNVTVTATANTSFAKESLLTSMTGDQTADSTDVICNGDDIDHPEATLECRTSTETSDGELLVIKNSTPPGKIVLNQNSGSCSKSLTESTQAGMNSTVTFTPVITFDEETDISTFVGPSPCVILQTLTMSNANDFFNLERLETIGDSFLKFAITVYLYCTYPGIHEGKLSYLRSKQVSNYNLYKLGKKKAFPECMVASKFEPIENWLPPGYCIRQEGAFKGLNVAVATIIRKPQADEAHEKSIQADEDGIDTAEASSDESTGSGKGKDGGLGIKDLNVTNAQQKKFNRELEECTKPEELEKVGDSNMTAKCLIPYNLQTQHSLPDKSIADCVEALIGCYLTECGQRAALHFMSWLGLKVLPDTVTEPGQDSSTITDGKIVPGFGELRSPPSPLLTHVINAEGVLRFQLDGYSAFEERIQYTFRDRSYLLQAFTHASYHYNKITDCYQRLEFLGDAILDYVITRHLFEDPRKHSPGILTDLRSALVNNNIFAALAVKWDFHKYFKAISPQLFHVVDKFVAWQKSKDDEICLDEELFDNDEDKEPEGEDIEIPKALGDIFESVAGAIYLDSGMSLNTVWKVYYRMMKPQIDAFTEKIPKSPVRELLEMEPETAKFERPERTFDGKIRVTVNVVGKGKFRGLGRNYRIAKSAAAKRALKAIKTNNQRLEQLAEEQMGALLSGASST